MPLPSQKRKRLLVSFLAVLTVAVGVMVLRVENQRDFRVDVLDVGQGDAVLITTPDRVRILYDGGRGDNVLRPLGKVMPFWARNIDLLIVSHPHEDHYAGFIPILRRYKVGAVLRTDYEVSTASFAALVRATESAGVLDERLYLGDKITVSDGTQMVILWPPEADHKSLSENESSIVGQLSYGGYRFLLTGDAGIPSERHMVNHIKPEYLRAEVLRTGHHGSRGSTGEEFLQAVRPRIAVNSSGVNNRYGHPAPEVLERLRNIGAEIFRTDLNGTVSLVVGEQGLIVSAEK